MSGRGNIVVMAFSDIALLAADSMFQRRVAACVATESIVDTNVPQAAAEWAFAQAWTMAAMPGFGEKFSSALASGVADPGNDPSVISDADILSAVQSTID